VIGRHRERKRPSIQILLGVIPGRIEDASPESIPPDIQAARWIPGLRLPRK
jgi:hypothetical protein